MNNRAPLIVAIVLLLLPMLYVGSYLALVNPGDYEAAMNSDDFGNRFYYFKGYRTFDGSRTWPSEIAPAVFWPLKQIDKKLRPQAWGIAP